MSAQEVLETMSIAVDDSQRHKMTFGQFTEINSRRNPSPFPQTRTLQLRPLKTPVGGALYLL